MPVAVLVAVGFSSGCSVDTMLKAQIRNFSWYCLRHTFASRLVMAGVSLKAVQELMGHKTIQMTARYAHLSPGHLQSAVELISGAISSNQRRIGFRIKGFPSSARNTCFAWPETRNCRSKAASAAEFKGMARPDPFLVFRS